ncbi:MAG: glycosyltransferase [Deltaproteobacteria bacterium]|nr:glycosyltransferase [Deltaproteobacteria bacterium]
MDRRARLKTRVVQVLIVLNVVLATRYIVWRSLYSVNWELWVLALALLAAEMFSYTDTLLFGMNMWRLRQRGEPPPAPPDLTVDVFITTYNEPVDLVRETAVAAREIRYPHNTWVLDDGNRPEMRAAAEEIGVGYLVRNQEWLGKDRHAKAGNIINAMYQTTGEFMMILDADQVPRPHILDRVLGYFGDEKVAFVQTPQWFKNTPDGDPFGTDAPLFYGPIQAGKDGWNSAFFCGSNAVLRREALMRIGVVWYTRELEKRVKSALHASAKLLRRTRASLTAKADPRAVQAIEGVLGVVKDSRVALRKGEPLQAVTWNFQRGVERVSRAIVEDDMAQIRAELEQLPGYDPSFDDEQMETMLRGLSNRDMSPLGAIGAVKALMTGIDLDRADEAVPVLPMSTVSITEDMATAMRLHALGWTSVYHHEVLAVGLAPEDLVSALQQRLRWAQGTLQVLLRENPLIQPGLSLAQRLLYFGTMWSYLSGFAAIVYLSAPMLYLVFGLMPVEAYSAEFFGYLLPWLFVNQLLFIVIGWGLATKRGQQYSLALFPLWLKAVTTTVGNVYFGRKLGFVVTPKTRQDGVHLGLVWPQILVMILLTVSIGVGFVRLALGWTNDPGPVFINAFWACYSLAMLSVVLQAATWKPRVVTLVAKEKEEATNPTSPVVS